MGVWTGIPMGIWEGKGDAKMEMEIGGGEMFVKWENVGDGSMGAITYL